MPARAKIAKYGVGGLNWCVTLATFRVWNNLCDLVYSALTRTYKSVTAVAFGILVMRLSRLHIKHLPSTPC